MNEPLQLPSVLSGRGRRWSTRLLDSLRIVALVMALAAGALLGCDKSASVGGGYQISASIGPEGQAGQNSLSYNGIRICDGVLAQQYHGETLVFMASLHESSPQLFAVRGAGPRVLLSERLVTDPRAFVVDDFRTGRPKPGINYYVEDLTSTPDGVRVRFYVTTDDTSGEKVYETHDVTWPEINGMMQEAQTTGTVRNDKSGSYLSLARKPQPQVAVPPGRSRHRRHPAAGDAE